MVADMASIGSGNEHIGLVLEGTGRVLLVATLVGSGLSASLVVQPHYVDEGYSDLVRFLDELEEQWRGWDGVRRWKSLEGEFSLAARHTGSHVVLRAELSNTGFNGTAEWTARLEVALGAGEDLTSAASAVRGALR